MCSVKAENNVNLVVPSNQTSTATIKVTDDCTIKFLEHVQAHISLNATKRGDVLIKLTSPSNTTSVLVDKRPKDYSNDGFTDWPFLTVRKYSLEKLHFYNTGSCLQVHMWEESPLGTWTIQVVNEGQSIITLTDWSLSLLGTEVHPTEAAAEPYAHPIKDNTTAPEVEYQATPPERHRTQAAAGSKEQVAVIVSQPPKQAATTQKPQAAAIKQEVQPHKAKIIKLKNTAAAEPYTHPIQASTTAPEVHSTSPSENHLTQAAVEPNEQVAVNVSQPPKQAATIQAAAVKQETHPYYKPKIIKVKGTIRHKSHIL